MMYGETAMTDNPRRWGRRLNQGQRKTHVVKKPKPKGVYPLPAPGPNPTRQQHERHTFAVNLYNFMQQNLLSQADLARETGINADTISSWLKEARTPTKKYLRMVCDRYQIAPQSLTGDTTVASPPSAKDPNKTEIILQVTPEMAEVIGKLLRNNAKK